VQVASILLNPINFTFSTQTFRYVLIKVPVNNRNQNWRVWGFRILNNTSNRIRVNNTSDFEVGDTVAIYNHASSWSDHNPYGYTSNMYPYIQAGSGSENVIGDLKGREYKILGKDGALDVATKARILLRDDFLRILALDYYLVLIPTWFIAIHFIGLLLSIIFTQS
jgi:uncharacterized protein with beta-barrel porin domain